MAKKEEEEEKKMRVHAIISKVTLAFCTDAVVWNFFVRVAVAG